MMCWPLPSLLMVLALVLPACRESFPGPPEDGQTTAPTANNVTTTTPPQTTGGGDDMGTTPTTTPNECANLSEEDCLASTTCSTIKGRTYDEANSCVPGTTEFVGCRPSSEGCSAAVSYGLDGQGACWRFDSGCQPFDYTRIDASDPACLDVLGGQLCGD